MNRSRTENSIKNVSMTFICQLLHTIFSFVNRTVLTWQLGAEYLGINGLFTNILVILSFAELGIGNTLVYRLYAPFASNDHEKITAYIQWYKKIYRGIIAVVSVCGIVLLPFLRFIVQAPEVKESLELLYLLYLIDTIISYAFVYKKSLFIADQKSYIVSLFTQGFNIGMNIVQCIVLILSHNFVLYFCVRIGSDLLNNVCCSIYAQRQYSYISEPVKMQITKYDAEGLKSDAKGLVLGNIASVAFGGTDNIFISKFIGIASVGILSNYLLILTTFNAMMNNVFNSITASIGNLSVVEDIRNTEKLLYRVFFLNATIYCYICVGMMLLLQEFVTKIWLSEEYFLSTTVIILCVVELFYRSVHFPIHTVRNALGLFSQYKILFALSAVLNILLDFILIRPMGIAGLMLATILCRGITYVIDVYVVYHLGFHTSPVSYIKKLLVWSGLLTAGYLLLRICLMKFSADGLMAFAGKIVLISVVYVLSWYMLFRKSEEFLYMKGLLHKIVRRRRSI